MKRSYSHVVLQLLFCLSLLAACSSDHDEPTPNPNNGNTPGKDVALLSFSPQTAFIGDTITVEGKNLGTNPQWLSFKFGNVPATVTEASGTSAKIIVPDELEGSSMKIQLLSTKGLIAADKDFKLKAPVIESFSPASGFVGQRVVIKGRGFSKYASFRKVTLGDRTVEATTADRGELTIYIPEGTAAGKYPIAVTIAGLTAVTSEMFNVVVPEFTGFAPRTAFIGDTVTITGRGLGVDPDALSIRFGDVDARVVSVSETVAKVIVPDDIAEASVKIRLFVTGVADIISAEDFILKAPVIESISHVVGLPGQLIRIKGKGFRNSYKFDQISFGETFMKANSITPGNTELIMHVPNKTAAGKYTVAVRVLGMTATAPDQFEVRVPTITSFTPNSGTQLTTITITGTNFKDPNGGNTGVVFSDFNTSLNTRAAYIISLTSTEIKVDVPELPKGTWKITVMVLGGSVTAAEPFTYTEE